MYQFPCPYCSTRLRLQDRTWRGRTVNCPDCRQPVLIDETVDGLIGLKTQRTAASTAPPSPLPHTPSGRWKLVAWGGTVALAALISTWLWPGEHTKNPQEPQPLPPTVAHQAPVPQPLPEPAPQPETVEQRLQALFRHINARLNDTGTYPQPEGTLSWLSSLPPSQVSAPGRHPELAWDAPGNDQFVRRRITNWQNPLLKQLVGDDGYPAGHFAGLTGVGADAATLPKDHPRAGIFGMDRITTTEDVRDGLANTILVVGVEQRVGSWAAPGEATLRSFSQEPYVHGPDGLGTGQPEGMFVLLADGSVKFLSAQTNPVILRRMAAMADGLPLDEQIAGDPLSMPPVPTPDKPPVPTESDPPITVELAPEPPPFNVQRAIQQRLKRFEQTKPLTIEQLLFQWSELAALPVDASAVPREKLQQELQLDVSEVTLDELLQQILSPAGLSAELDDRFGVRVK